MNHGLDLEPQPDGSVVVRGVSIAELEARLTRRAGRPPLPEIRRDEILEAIAERLEYSLPIDQVELAADLACSRTRLRLAVAEHFGSWQKLSATWRP